MTIEGAISYYEGQAVYAKDHGYPLAGDWNGQIAAWLRELQERRKAPEIITCGECVNFSERDFCKVAGHNVHRKSNCIKVFGAERRTDEQSD